MPPDFRSVPALLNEFAPGAASGLIGDETATTTIPPTVIGASFCTSNRPLLTIEPSCSSR
jgi:hypothetical protein